MALEEIYRGMQNGVETIQANLDYLEDLATLKSKVVWTGNNWMDQATEINLKPSNENVKEVELIFSRYDAATLNYGFNAYRINLSSYEPGELHWRTLSDRTNTTGIKVFSIDANNNLLGNEHNATDTNSKWFALRRVVIYYV